MYTFRILLLAPLICLGLFVQSAHAYIDPGTGSYVLQLILAAVFAAGFAIKIMWKRIVDFFSGLFGKKKDADADADPVAESEEESDKE